MEVRVYLSFEILRTRTRGAANKVYDLNKVFMHRQSSIAGYNRQRLKVKLRSQLTSHAFIVHIHGLILITSNSLQ